MVEFPTFNLTSQEALLSIHLSSEVLTAARGSALADLATTDTKKVMYISRNRTLSAAVPPPGAAGPLALRLLPCHGARAGRAGRRDWPCGWLPATFLNPHSPTEHRNANFKLTNLKGTAGRQSPVPFERPQPAADSEPAGPSDTGSLSR
jgi:hypothetical protein